jgi:hypothetical protein
MIQRVYCLNCAIENKLENNPRVLVMSTDSREKLTWCRDCDKKIGNSSELNELGGIYHIARHKINDSIYKRSKSSSIEELHMRLMQNKLNGNSLDCLINIIRQKYYSDSYVEKSFYKLVSKDDYYSTQKNMVNELVDISHANWSCEPRKWSSIPKEYIADIIVDSMCGPIIDQNESLTAHFDPQKTA